MKGYLLLLLLFIPATGFSQEATLSGHVSSRDSTVIAGASITVRDNTLGTVTDKNGFFQIKKMKPGSYTVRVSFIGFETEEKEVQLSAGENGCDFVLKESNFGLSEIVVTGTRSEKYLKNVPVVTQVIPASKMLDLSVTNVTDALEASVPGLSMSQFGTRASVTLQGMDSKYVLFLVDGERIAGEVNGDIDYSMLNLENIDRIEVIKGASSSLYGSNAIGGVINIITKKISDPFDARFYSRYSKYNEIFTGGTVGLRKGIVGSRTSLDYSHNDGYDLTPESTHDWTQNPYNSFSVNQKFEITPGPHFLIVPHIGYYRFERGNVSARPAHDLYNDLNAGLKAQYFFGKNLLTFSYYHDRYNTYDVLEKLNDQKDMVAYDILQTIRTQADFHLSEKNTFITGLEYNHEDVFSLRINGNKKGVGEAVGYAQEDIRLTDNFSLIGGFRVSMHESYGFNFAPKISMLYKAGPLNLRASAGTGFRSPELKELYMNFDHFGEWYIIGNTSLKPESSRYISSSVEFVRSWNNSSVTVYRNSLSNMITDRWLPDTVQLTRQYQNVASASVYGLDLMTKQKVFKNLWVTGGYSYVHSTDNETGLQLYGTTKHSGNISADYMFRKKNYSLTAQVKCRLMGEKFYEITDQGVSRDRPFSSWKFTLSQEYKWARFSVGVDNIFNIVIPQNLDFISPGRRLFAGINIDFGKIK